MYTKVQSPLIILPLGSKDTGFQHYLKTIRIIIFDYFTLLNKPTWENILKYRYENSETLEAIGTRYGYTKERVRQILKVIHNHIRTLINGNEIKNPHCKCDPAVVENINLSARNEPVFKKDLLAKLSTMKAGGQEEQHYLYFMMEILGHTLQEYNGIEFFSRKNLSDLCQRMEDYMHEVSSITIEELSQVFKKSQKTIQAVLSIIHNEKLDDQTYRLPTHYLSKIDRIYRYLKDKGEPAHYTELHKIAGISYRSSSGRLAQDGRFKSVGKSGVWGLSEWRINTDTVRDLIDKTLIFLNRPADLSEIVQIIHLSRPECPKKNIRSIIYAYREKFTWVDDTVIALKQWNYTSKPFHSRKPPTIITKEEFNKILVEIVGDRIMTSTEIIQALHKRIPKLKHNSILSKVYGTPMLTRVPTPDHENQKCRLVKNYEEMMGVSQQKSDEIKDIALKILSERKEMPLSELVSLLMSKGFKRISCYCVLQQSNQFIRFPSPNKDPRYKVTRSKMIRLV